MSHDFTGPYVAGARYCNACQVWRNDTLAGERETEKDAKIADLERRLKEAVDLVDLALGSAQPPIDKFVALLRAEGRLK